MNPVEDKIQGVLASPALHYQGSGRGFSSNRRSPEDVIVPGREIGPGKLVTGGMGMGSGMQCHVIQQKLLHCPAPHLVTGKQSDIITDEEATLFSVLLIAR